MKLKTKFLFLGGVIFAVSSTNLGSDLYGSRKLDESITQQQLATQVMQRHMDGDMRHDGIRGDVMESLVALSAGDADRLKASQESLEENQQAFAKDVEANMAEDLPENIKALLTTVKQSLGEYLGAARAVMTAPDYETGVAKLSQFTVIFERLETDQEKATDAILAWSEAGKNRFEQEAAMMDKITYGIDALLLLIAIGIPLFASRGVFRPQSQMMHAMERIAQGDTAVEIPYTGSRDEMGEMARTVQVFKDNALRIQGLAQEQEEAQRRAQTEKKASMEKLAHDFEANVKNVVDMVASAATEMDATAKQVASIAESSREKLVGMNSEVGQATNNVQSVAAATNQLSAAINEINKQVSRSTEIATNAVNEANHADGTVQELVQAASKIGEVVEMINSIAEQINLLALNATIEAARAGDAGKGFAVVASEVKSLATQTTKATGEITAYIQSIQSTTNDTVNVIKAIGGTIREINGISTAIAAAVEEQGVTTRDIAQNVTQAAGSTQEAAKEAESVTASASETREAADQMTAATSELSRQAEILRSEVDKFLNGVRQAA